MSYYKNVEVARAYKVSNPTVGAWIKASLAGRNNLKVKEVKNKFRIEINEHNRAEMARLAKEFEDRKPETKTKVCAVDKKFYEIFNLQEQIEIFNDLETKKTINIKWGYRKILIWDKGYKEGRYYIGIANQELMERSVADIKFYTPEHSQYIIYDLGAGNGLPIIPLLKYLKNKVELYKAVDISDEMLSFAKDNLSNLGLKYPIKFENLDFETQSLQTTLNIEAMSKTCKSKISKIILILGNTLMNFENYKEVVRKIADCINHKDIIVLTFAIDNLFNRSYFNYMKYLPEEEVAVGWMYTMLGIDVGSLEVEFNYDPEKKIKTKHFILDKNYDIEFDVGKGKQIISLKKGEKLLRWFHSLLEVEDFVADMKEIGLEILTLKTDKVGANALAILRLKNEEAEI
jgi:SAM-dependent methyltransferase